MSDAGAAAVTVSATEVLLPQLTGLTRVVFDLDGTLYDSRDFERPALAAVARWMRERSGQPLQGLERAMWERRETRRHDPGLFDEQLDLNHLPRAWGARCAQLFRDYPGTELTHAASLRETLACLRSQGTRLALVTNGRQQLQQRKLRYLGLDSAFDARIYCDPEHPCQLKPSDWAWQQLRAWRDGTAITYVGDDPVDAQFATAGGARFVKFLFRNPAYGN